MLRANFQLLCSLTVEEHAHMVLMWLSPWLDYCLHWHSEEGKTSPLHGAAAPALSFTYVCSPVSGASEATCNYCSMYFKLPRIMQTLSVTIHGVIINPVSLNANSMTSLYIFFRTCHNVSVISIVISHVFLTAWASSTAPVPSWGVPWMPPEGIALFQKSV